MIRLSTLFCAALAAMSGLYLYHVKYQTQLLDRSIIQINQSIEASRDRAEVLKAEWTLLNDPERLAALAGQFLSLGTVSPKQFTALADLPNRLPAPRPLAPTPTETTDEPAEQPDENATMPLADVALPLPPTAPEPPSSAVLITRAPPTVSPPSKPRAMEAAPRPRLVVSPASVSLASATPTAVSSAPRPSPRAASSVPTRVTEPPAAHAPMPVVSASSLGMARSIAAPPVPIASGTASNTDLRGEIRYARGN